jgi:outer membrane murein-binding lipoprotein Lpp
VDHDDQRGAAAAAPLIYLHLKQRKRLTRPTVVPSDLEAEVTRSTLFDRLNQELEAFGKKAQAALDEGKLQIELLRIRRRRDNAARDLGMLVYRRDRGQQIEAARVEAIMSRIDELQAEIERLERQVAASRSGTGAQREGSAPEGAV